MSGAWKTMSLESAGRWLSGGTPSKANPELWAGPIPWVSPKDMKRSRLSTERLFALRLACPPGPEQRKIGAILSSVDDTIEATQAVIDQLQVVKQSLMAELFARGIPRLHTRFRVTDIGEVPETREILG